MEGEAKSLHWQEANFIARRAWPELAQFYRNCVDAAASAAERVEWRIRLAELLENELNDPEGALRVWADVVRESGDDVALREQVRLLRMWDDASGIRQAVDLAVASAQAPEQGARVLTLRAELHLRAGDTARAREDFTAALALVPRHLPALAGLAETEASLGTKEAVYALASALEEAPRHFAGRLDLYRRLARLAADTLALEAWREVLLEKPDDAEARSRLEALARKTGDDETLVDVLEAWLDHVPRGLEARAAWMERVTALERLGRYDEALAVLRKSVQFEPGHKEAWLALAERCEAGRMEEEAAWALEQAAMSTADEEERAGIWLRLTRLAREHLHDPARAEIYERRGRRLLDEAAAAGDPGSRVPTEVELPVAAEPRGPEDDFLEVTSGDVVIEQLEPQPLDPGPTPSHPTPGLHRLQADRVTLVERVRAAPLEPLGYRALGELFERLEDFDRSALMLEIADALQGRERDEPSPPRLILSATDRAGLRHPALRREDGEVLALAGTALCRTRGTQRGLPDEVFGLESGRGANAAAEALLVAVRTLGLPAPEVLVSEENGPPFSLVFAAGAAHLLVGRAALRRELPGAELRFFAGRALFMQNPDLMVLRTVDRNRLGQGLSALSALFQKERGHSAEAAALRAELPKRSLHRIEELLPKLSRPVPMQRLLDAARHSANRAGLVVCGGVAPALAALRAKKALEAEVLELIRFAASERYLQLRLLNLHSQRQRQQA